MSADEAPDRQRAIEIELSRVEESARYSAQNQFEMAKHWKRVNWLLGIPASTLAAVAGGAALASTAGRVPAGIVALVSAALAAIQTTVNAAQRHSQAASVANAYLEIQTAARQAREIDLPHQPDLDEARALLAELTARRDEQNKTAEVPNRRARKRAQKNLAEGGQTYAVDIANNDEGDA